MQDLAGPRLVVIADALAKNVALSRDEREVSKVLEAIEPFAAELARSGRSPSNRRQMLRTIGQALAGASPHVRTGRGARRSRTCCGTIRSSSASTPGSTTSTSSRSGRSRLTRKLGVIEATTRALTDLIDTDRSIRLEATIVALIVVEILITFYEIFVRATK